jgi:hypothetical protein
VLTACHALLRFALPVLQVQQLLVKHEINTDSARQRGGGSSSSADDDDDEDGLGLANADMFDSDEEGGGGGGTSDGAATRRVRMRKGAAAVACRLPVSLDRLRQLYERHAPAAAGDGSEAAAAAAGDDEQKQQQQEVWLDAIAQELPVPASSSQVLAWLQQGGIVPAAAAAGGARRRSSGAVLLADGGGSTQQQKKKRQRAARALLDSDDDDGGGGDRDATQGGGGRKARLAAAAATVTGGGGGGPAAAAVGSSSGRVPEPEPLRLLGCLQALQNAHDDSGRCESCRAVLCLRAGFEHTAGAGQLGGFPHHVSLQQQQPLTAHPPTPTHQTCHRWMGAAGAVAWVLGKLDAAEAVWAAAARVAAAADMATAAAAADYALVPSGDGDMEYFCSDWSNEVLEAAGVRNDSDDFFKVCVV